MKNIYLRLAVIGGVVALGAAAIGQSMMASRKADPEPIEISQLPETPTETAPVPPSFPPSQVVLAAGEAPTSSGSTSEPSAADASPSQPPSARFRFQQNADTPTPAGTASAADASGNPAASADGSSPPSRFSRFLGGAGSGAPRDNEDDSAETPSTTNTATTNTAASGGSPTPTVGRFGSPSAPAENPANPAAANPAGATPPPPQRFAISDSDANDADTPAADSPDSTDTAANIAGGGEGSGMDQPPVRFRMADQPTPAAMADAAQQVAGDAQEVVEETADAMRGAMQDAGTRFSSTADSARQNLSDEVSRHMNADGQAPSPGTQPQPMTRFQSQPTPAEAPADTAVSSSANPAANPSAMAGSADREMPQGDGREDLTSATPMPSQGPMPSVIGSPPPQAGGSSPSPSSAYAPAASLGSAPVSSYGGSPRYGAPPSESTSSGSGTPASNAGLSGTPSAAPSGGGATASVPGMLVSARPGDARLEGDQTPSIRLEKIAPPEVQVGKVTTFELHVENTSSVKASNVIVRDMVPAGTKLVSTSPQADQGSDGSLVWQLGTLEPQERKNLKLEILPLEEGNIGSVASVSFAAMASSNSVVTRPKLLLEQSGSAKVLAGQQLGITITLSNPGTGAATGVVLEENVPAGFTHPAGSELEFEVGTLKPGESRQLELVLHAESAGQTQNLLRARADGNLTAEDALALEVIAPKLQVSLSGPKMRYLDRPATYTVSISNPGTAPAHDIDVVTYLPKGLKFVEANNAGQYDATRHAVFWSLEQLPPSQTGAVELVALPIEPGDQRLRVESTADTGLTAQHESTVRVEGLAAIYFEVVDLADPIEVGEETTYEIKVVNQGSKDATNVQVAAQLPQGLQALAADGDAKGQISGQQVVYQAIPRIGPKQSAKLTLKAQGAIAGDQRLRVQVTTDGIPDPITKEESTTVYSDK